MDIFNNGILLSTYTVYFSMLYCWLSLNLFKLSLFHILKLSFTSTANSDGFESVQSKLK